MHTTMKIKTPTVRIFKKNSKSTSAWQKNLRKKNQSMKKPKGEILKKKSQKIKRSMEDNQEDARFYEIINSEKLQVASISTATTHDIEDDNWLFKNKQEEVEDENYEWGNTNEEFKVALSTVHWEYGFGNMETRNDLVASTPNSMLYYDVEMVSPTEEKESWDMDTLEKIDTVKKKKKVEL
eukprot:Gb_30014 [translate_table: standard]